MSYIKPYHPVSKNTISRWVTQVLQSAGIDIAKYSAHSIIAAATSNCKQKKLNIKDILEAAGLSNSTTFARFYYKPTDNVNLNFGTVLLGP